MQAGLSPGGISDLERGARAATRLETVRLLADALGMDDAERAVLLAVRAGTPAQPKTRFPSLNPDRPTLPIPPTLSNPRSQQ